MVSPRSQMPSSDAVGTSLAGHAGWSMLASRYWLVDANQLVDTGKHQPYCPASRMPHLAAPDSSFVVFYNMQILLKIKKMIERILSSNTLSLFSGFSGLNKGNSKL